MKTQLLCELLGTYFKIVDQINSGDIPFHDEELNTTKMISQSDTGEGFDTLRELLLNVCSYFHENMKSHDERRRKGIIGYINNHYNDKMLCLSKISDHFNLSESYFSRFFKEQLGETFSLYLERFRINQAKQLLISTELSVDTISRKTGYCNTRTFRRAFKRINGICPKSYKI